MDTASLPLFKAGDEDAGRAETRSDEQEAPVAEWENDEHNAGEEANEGREDDEDDEDAGDVDEASSSILSAASAVSIRRLVASRRRWYAAALSEQVFAL